MIEKIENFIKDNRKILSQKYKENPYFFWVSITMLILFFVSWMFNVEFKIITNSFLFTAIFLLILVVTATSAIISFKSLFHIAAPLSLIIFLTQSYCSVPKNLRLEEISDASMRTVLHFGMLYVSFMFFKELWRLTLKFKNSKPEDAKKDNKWFEWASMILLGLFIAFFLISFYQVLNPIYQNMCIIK